MRYPSILFLTLLTFAQLSCTNRNSQNISSLEKVLEDSVADIDGNVYHSIKIGTQIWMLENLKVTHYRNGDSIPNISNTTEWSNLSTGAYCDYDNDSLNSTIYGKLYNWFTIKDGRNIAPKGWHIPTHSEWNILEKYIDSSIDTTIAGSQGTDIGCKLREAGISHWIQSTKEANNSSGFTALPGASRRGMTGVFGRIGEFGHWWTSTEHPASGAWCRDLFYRSCKIGRGNGLKETGFSIRCIKNK